MLIFFIGIITIPLAVGGINLSNNYRLMTILILAILLGIVIVWG